MQPRPLRGRSEPMERALAVVRAANRHGSGGVVLVSGTAGIGKSALLAEVCRQAERMQIQPALGVCDPIDQVSPGAPVITALRTGGEPLVGAEQYEHVVDALHEPLLLVERIASALESVSAKKPVLIAIDDVQWADRVSKFLIRMLLTRLLGLPVVWLLATRDHDADILGSVRTHLEHIRLTPLTSADLADIAQDRLGHPPDERTRRFLDASAGNPLLALDVLDNLVSAAAHGKPDTVPEEFGTAIARRLAELPDASRALIEVVAVSGRAVSVQEALRLVAEPAGSGRGGPLAAALDSGLITVTEQNVTARHDLVREAVLAAMPDDTVRTLHRRFAEHHLGAGQALLAAPHARAAATRGDVAGALILIAAAEQLGTASPQDAGDLAALAFRTVLPEQTEWLDVGRRCLSVLCQTQRAREAVAVADVLLAHVDDADLVGAVESEAARALWLGGRLGELLTRVEPVLTADSLTPAVGARLTAARALANTRLMAGEPAAREATAALECARACRDKDALVLALHAVGEAARNEGRHQDALKSFRELRTLVGPLRLAEEITSLQFLDRYDHAQLLLEEVRSDSRNSTRSILPALHCAQMWQDFNLGHSDDAESTARTLVELGQQLGSEVYALDALIVQISVELLRGNTRSAAALLAQTDQLVDTDDGVRNPGLTVMRGWLSAGQGDIGQAIEVLGPVALGAVSSCSYWPLWPCWMGLFFEIGTAGANGAFSEVVVQIAELAATRNPGVASFEGVALSLRGRAKGDLPMIAESARVLARSPRPILRAYGADVYGRALLADGQRDQALELLDRAWDDYHRMDARVYRDVVQQAMRQAGARRSKWSTAATRPESGWASLTAAERRVALLIADGHSNRSAAGELGVSVNTVGTHLRMVFSKLGVQSRVQLANAVNRDETTATRR
ncbi:AAA family ATPase [Streptomyces sp. NBC_01092]|uniref:helix-turn-helix transcriptional regulator n=1 Tax=Streptomyces sp. NBC_01092 TaxID=2903748 RepID=UPI0038636971|nr:AAA family ATPase [Streptomyces sp. NBC_01092]